VRVPTRDEVEVYKRDGVVCLRGLIPTSWLERLAVGVEENMAAPGPWANVYTPEGAPGRFFDDYVNWQRIDAYRAFAFESGIARVAGALMQSKTVRFYHEHVLVKEPGTREITPWHHDQPYYGLDGEQNASVWLPLDPIPSSVALEFIAGSHRWRRQFVPKRFVDGTPYAPGGGMFEPLPDLEAQRRDYTILSWPLDPGDVLVFHFKTLHSAPGTEGLAGRRRAVSTRWLGDDAKFAERPWPTSPPFEARDLHPGGSFAGDARFPLIPS